MKQFDHLTHERLGTMFENQFELVNYAIKLAEYFISTGKEPFVYHDTQNLATQILEIIESGKEKYRNILDQETLVAEIEAAVVGKNQATEIDIEVDEDDDEEDSEESAQTIEAV